ncbi:DegT/DnrJ/EryC1/StrS family aminotransferase [Aestuariispira insulae]|uniref:dTDP-4-amino-4,6-dideoxygalactose transaminase n=1 Tax=Aestuariispira insulae TaxID=1461337 RepID=A0A3D9HSG5_9PROT|nr:DegT/DnrJ/EryC1/StrS family aminotransferase [Aestuariispira insulae]RED52448.1 dTDP-4-amino-4,6-dideoxygalactose transaminase [Aestuariispira insulae]
MTNKPSIPFGKPQISQAELDAVKAVFDSGMLVHGTVTPAFEEAFAKRIGTKHAVAVASCTAGMHLTLFVREIGQGHKVAVPAMTHAATAHCVELAGATPVFVDVAPTTGNICPDQLDALTEPLSVIMPVHYLGLTCEMDRIQATANRHGAFILEDCAVALDAEYKGRKAGNLGLAGSFSFYPVKHMTSIEGGMVTTNDDQLAAQLRKRRAFGYNKALGERSRPGLYDVDELGFNYRMSEIEAAVGLAQMKRLNDFQAARAKNARALARALKDVEELTILPPPSHERPSTNYCLNVVLPKDGSISREGVMDVLKEDGIGFSVHYPGAVPLFTYYKEKYGYKEGQFPVAEWLASQTLSLPVGPHLTEGDPERIAEAVKDAVVKSRSS